MTKTTRPTMRVFKVTSGGKTFHTVIAPDIDAAKRISVKVGYARKVENIRDVVDVTSDLGNRYNMPSILKLGKTGYITSQRVDGLGHGMHLAHQEQVGRFVPTSIELRYRLVKIVP